MFKWISENFMKTRIFILLLCIIILLSTGKDKLNNYLKMSQKDPGNYELCNKIGLLYIQKNEYKTAKNYFAKAIILNNNYFEGYYNLTLLYYHLNDFSNAIVNIKRAIAINNKKVNTYIILINCYIRLKKWKMAKALFKETIAKFSEDNYKLLNCGGVLQLKEKKYKQAKEYFRKALKIKNDVKIKNNLAIAEYYSGNHKKAKDILKSLGNDYNIMKENYKLLK